MASASSTYHTQPGHYYLSAVLGDLDDQVRDVAIASDNLLATVCMNGAITVWDRDDLLDDVEMSGGAGEAGGAAAAAAAAAASSSSSSSAVSEEPSTHCRFARRALVFAGQRVHTGLVLCAEYLGSGEFVSGGGDKVARRWTAEGEVRGDLRGHTDSVNSLARLSNGDLATGSWDGTVRIWRLATGECVSVLDGHLHATEVLELATGELVTASANKAIHIHDATEAHSRTRTITNAHGAPVRKLVRHPLGFASCGNDGFVKIWSSTGDVLQSIPAHVGGPTDTFCYSVAVLPNGNLVSCGEDATVRIWRPDGTDVQLLKHPGPVRSVKVMPNGDLVTCCNDRTARVFTTDPSRMATPDELFEYEQHVTMADAANAETLDPSNYPGPEALESTGRKDGEFKMIAEGGKVWVYQWKAATGNWEKIGEATGRRQAKELVDGVPYDHVTEVYVNETQKVKLGWNRDEAAEDVAHRFCTMYSLPAYTRQQIIEHVAPMTDKHAIAERKAREEAQAERVSMKQVPCWRTGGFRLETGAKIAAMKKALLKANTELAEAGAPGVLSERDLVALDLLMAVLNTPATYHSSTIGADEVRAFEKMSSWPANKALPVIDALRVMMLHSDALAKLDKKPQVRSRLLGLLHSEAAGVHHFRIMCQAMANWIAKRNQTSAEFGGSIPAGLEAQVGEALDACAGAASSSKQSVVAAYVSLLHNVVCWLGSRKIEQTDLTLQIVTGLFAVLGRAENLKSETRFYALLTLTSLAHASKQALSEAVDLFGDTLSTLRANAAADSARAMQELAGDMRKVFP